jgi:hypothetical protein
MTAGPRVTPGLVHEVLDALERHGYYRGDDLHADRAIGLIGDLACIYEGTQDHPACCPSLKIPMKAALATHMWGCCKAPQPWWLRGLGGGGACGCG